MSILDDLLATLPDAPVRAVLVGAQWTVVCSGTSPTGGSGLASTITGDKPHGHAAVRDVGRLHLKSARALVGHFPFIPRLREQVGQLWVIEQRPADGEHPAEAATDLIPQADVVALTGSALINHTLDGLLALCRPDALVMVLGPSTPLSPVLFDHGAALISGTRVVDEAAVLRTVGQGATFQQVEGVKLLTLERAA